MFVSNLNRLLYNFDLILKRNSYSPYLEFLDRLKRSQIKIDVIWDVGAFRGEWTKQTKKHLPSARYILFEPNDQHNIFLKNTSSEFHNMILGKEDNDVKFFSHGGTGDSMYPEFDEFLKVRSEFRSARSYKIDTLIKDHQNFPPPDFLKLDVQGAELDVLNGATETIKLVKVMLIECPIVNYNLGSPNIHEYLEFMFRNDFVPFFVTEIHRLQQIVTQIDIAFIAKNQFELKIKSLSDVGFWESTKLKYRDSTKYG